MVPYVKVRLGLDDAQLGAALLAFGGGSMLSMPFVGWLAHRLGNRAVIMSAGLLMCLALPALAQISSVTMLVSCQPPATPSTIRLALPRNWRPCPTGRAAPASS